MTASVTVGAVVISGAEPGEASTETVCRSGVERTPPVLTWVTKYTGAGAAPSKKSERGMETLRLSGRSRFDRPLATT